MFTFDIIKRPTRGISVSNLIAIYQFTSYTGFEKSKIKYCIEVVLENMVRNKYHTVLFLKQGFVF